MARLKIGVLGSGSGSNMQALLDAIEAGELDAEVVLVMSDNPDAYILERASKAGIATKIIDCLGYKTKFPEATQSDVAESLKQAGVEVVCLAGFLRLVKRPLLAVFPERIINIHPSLLPDFPGLHAWEQALEAGAKTAGCTVHYVDEGMDTGPIILQREVMVDPEDSAQSLHQKIQIEEHIAYPEALRQVMASLA